MKTHVLLAVAALFVSMSLSFGQSAYYDALTLRALPGVRPVGASGRVSIALSDSQAAFPILLRYASDKVRTEAQLIAAFDGNPFVGIQKSASASIRAERDISGAGTGSALGAIVKSIGGLDVTAFADGLGKFLAERTKEEMNVAFFERFREMLWSHPEVGHLFPITRKYLDNVFNFEYANMLSTLRAAFESDLRKLPANLATITSIKPEECDKCATDTKIRDCKLRLAAIKAPFATEEGTALTAGLLMIDGILEKRNPAEILSSITANENIRTMTAADGVRRDVYQSLRMLDIVSASLRSADASQIWISGDEFRSLAADSALLAIYCGLLYQQIAAAGIEISEVKIRDHFRPQNLQGIRNYLSRTVSATTDLVRAHRQIQHADTTLEARRLRIGALVGATREFLNTAITYNIISPAIPPPGPALQRVLHYTDQSLVIVEFILSKDYYNAVLNTVLVLDEILRTQKNFDVQGRLRGTSSQQRDSALDRKQFVSGVLKYGNFMANVVAAENADDVKKSIAAIALPPGSSLIKKTTNFSMAVQAYTGFTYGTVSNESASHEMLGVYAPVGLSASIGLKSHANPFDKRSRGSLSAFLSLVDIGAIVAYRFNDTKSNLADTVSIRLENIFAPGANLVYGFPKIPLALGGGLQWQPSLTRLNSQNATIAGRSGLRLHIFLALDLPMLHIASSGR